RWIPRRDGHRNTLRHPRDKARDIGSGRAPSHNRGVAADRCPPGALLGGLRHHVVAPQDEAEFEDAKQNHHEQGRDDGEFNQRAPPLTKRALYHTFTCWITPATPAI